MLSGRDASASIPVLAQDLLWRQKVFPKTKTRDDLVFNAILRSRVSRWTVLVYDRDM